MNINILKIKIQKWILKAVIIKKRKIMETLDQMSVLLKNIYYKRQIFLYQVTFLLKLKILLSYRII